MIVKMLQQHPFTISVVSERWAFQCCFLLDQEYRPRLSNLSGSSRWITQNSILSEIFIILQIFFRKCFVCREEVLHPFYRETADIQKSKSVRGEREVMNPPIEEQVKIFQPLI